MRFDDRPHRRFNPLKGEWILVSPHRAKRPWQGQQDEPDTAVQPAHDPDCYLCPGNSRAGGMTNPDYKDVFVFDNDFAALLPEASHNGEGGSALFRDAPATGTCRVICFSPDHGKTLPEMSADAIRTVVDTWAAQETELSATHAYVQIFENKGAMMGCSSPHPHGQIWAADYVPAEPAREDVSQSGWLADHGKSMLLAYAEAEAADGARTVAINHDWLAVVPFWASWPYEILLLPRFTVQRIAALEPGQRDSLAVIIQRVTTAYDNLFQTSFPYSMGWHGAPGTEKAPHWQLHAHFYPPLLRSASVRKFMVGYEMLAEAQRDPTPEAAAATLRAKRNTLPERQMTPTDRELRAKVTAAFKAQFGSAPDLVARAPGRVNLIGEHTDYNDGFVLPCAIGPATMVAARKRTDSAIRILAADFDNATDIFNLGAIGQSEQGWANYVRGMVDALQSAGHALTGADLAIAGNLPRGAGLSSSASLEVAVGQAMLAIAGTEIDRTRLAQIAQTAECDFVGNKCGIMDQLISAQGKAGQALLIDCGSLKLTDAPVPEDVAIMIIHSGVTRGLVEGHYNERRRQCEAAAQAMGVPALRGADLGMLKAAGLDEVTHARARHVITENKRTLDAAAALAKSDLKALGKLMAESHASMRDDFEITVPPIDRLVALLQSAIGAEGGARMTGGGFGGACVAILPTSKVREVHAAVEAGYRTPDGDPTLIMVERPGPGVGLV